ncbi:MAG: entericidin A/B family lipoprotein [Rhodobacter sp.]|nr:entericidin A/B family lipoprotein [Rhodobacter sp.]
MRRYAILILALLALGACETVEGVGQDISNAGRAMKRTF